jgi:hypothetical protein
MTQDKHARRLLNPPMASRQLGIALWLKFLGMAPFFPSFSYGFGEAEFFFRPSPPSIISLFSFKKFISMLEPLLCL